MYQFYELVVLSESESIKKSLEMQNQLVLDEEGDAEVTSWLTFVFSTLKKGELHFLPAIFLSTAEMPDLLNL